MRGDPLPPPLRRRRLWMALTTVLGIFFCDSDVIKLASLSLKQLVEIYILLTANFVVRLSLDHAVFVDEDNK